MTDPKSDMRIFKDSNALSLAAADMFVDLAAQAIGERGRFLVALSGGSTPAGLYRLLAVEPYRQEVDWSQTFIFWGDERLVTPDDADSNYRQAWDSFLSHVPIPNENILRIKGELDPAEASRDYSQSLKSYAPSPHAWPHFDLVLLGLGADGHTASLFPGSPIETSLPTLVVTADYDSRPAQRVTLTPLVFNAARQIVFLVSGESKSAALASVINGENKPVEIPAQRIQPTKGKLNWYVDEAAASKLANWSIP